MKGVQNEFPSTRRRMGKNLRSCPLTTKWWEKGTRRDLIRSQFIKGNLVMVFFRSCFLSLCQLNGRAFMSLNVMLLPCLFNNSTRVNVLNLIFVWKILQLSVVYLFLGRQTLSSGFHLCPSCVVASVCFSFLNYSLLGFASTLLKLFASFRRIENYVSSLFIFSLVFYETNKP